MNSLSAALDAGHGSTGAGAARPPAQRMRQSRFLNELCREYALAPSAVLIRTAEAELLSTLPMEGPLLDLCCGDGYFASLLLPGGMGAGCDRSRAALEQAHSRGQYQVLACADVARGLPFRDEAFRTVLSNSSLEHVREVDVTLQEITRVLRRGGRFYTTFASSYAYEWWPCGHRALRRYLEFQPVHNYPPLEKWFSQMEKAGLHVVGHQYYLSRSATRLMLFMDYHSSHVWLTSDLTAARPVIRIMRLVPRRALARLWQWAFGGTRIGAGERGGGVLIMAERPAL